MKLLLPARLLIKAWLAAARLEKIGGAEAFSSGALDFLVPCLAEHHDCHCAGGIESMAVFMRRPLSEQ
jgi:hypothetical protein